MIFWNGFKNKIQKPKKIGVMAKTKELLGLIVGFAAGTFLGALFVGADKTQPEKKKKDKKKEEARMAIEN